MHTNPATATRPAPPPLAIQFYSVEIMPLADGRMSVGIGATICETVDESALCQVFVRGAQKQCLHRPLPYWSGLTFISFILKSGSRRR
jgi:hypothetical protein